MASLLSELRRRHVFKIVGSYAVVAWLLIQVIVSVEVPLGLPDWSDTVVIVALVLGFPVCVVLAWIYDITARGIERTGDQAGAITPRTLTAADWWTIAISTSAAILLLLTSAYLVVGNLRGPIDTLAVLPFESVGDEADAQYLGDGIRDSLIMRLSRLQSLRIKTTAATGQDSASPQELGRLLGVDAVCMGRIEQRGGALEIVAELFDTDDGSIIWTEQYSSRTSSLLEIEGQVSAEVARQLGIQLSGDDEAALARASTANPAAHRLYLQGRYFWNRRTAEGFAASIQFYMDALGLDPNFALAHAGLAQTYLMILGWGLQPPGDVAPQVVESAATAIRLDPSLAEPHAALGYLKTIYERDWDGARSAFLRAIELNNNYSSAHHWYAFLLMTEGDMRAAVEEILLARELEPLSPIINAEVGYFYLFSREYERALDTLRTASLLDVNYPSTISYLARAHALLGQTDEAVEIINRWRTIVSNDLFVAAYGGMVLPMLGLADDARTIYEQLLALSNEIYTMPGLLGVLAATLGEYEAAVQHFEAGLEDRSLVLSWLRDPLLDDFREHPGYAEILTRAGLEP